MDRQGGNLLDRLGQLLGGPQQQEYQDFAQRYNNDPTQITDEEAARRYREMMSSGKIQDEDADEAHEESFKHMSEEERRQMAQAYKNATRDPNRPYQGYPQDMDLDEASKPTNLGRMTKRAGEEDPDLLGQLVGPNSPLNSTAAKLAMAGAAAYFANRFFKQQGGVGGSPFSGSQPDSNPFSQETSYRPPSGSTEV